MKWFRRHASSVSTAAIPIGITLGVTCVVFASLSLFIAFVVALAIGTSAYIIYSNQPQMKCRVCGTEDEMALEYESHGICRKCLLEIVHLPGVLGKQ